MIAERFEAHRPRLFAIAYRMLGTVMDAEDAVQEAYVRANRAASGGEAIDSEGAYLRTSIIHICMNALHSAHSTRETYIGPWLPAPLVTAPESDPADLFGRAETLSFALLRLMEQLSPEERAVFVLREAFACAYDEIAVIMQRTPAACRKLYSRGRARLRAEPLPTDDAESHSALTGRFMQAVTSGELSSLIDLFAEDAVLRSDGGGKATAARHPVHGARAVASFLIGLMRQIRAGETIAPVRVNGREGWTLRAADGAVIAVISFETHAGRIQQFYFVVNPDKLTHLEN